MIDISLKLERTNNVWNWLKSQENKLISAGHIGTHIDVYNKSEIPENYIKSRGVIIDCSNYRLDEEICMECIQGKEINNGDFIIFKTNIGEKYPYGSDIYIKNHHQLSLELIDYLINKKVHFIGIDCAGIRRGKEHFEADIKCENNNVYVVENLDLSQVTYYEKEISVYTIWINNPIVTGLATRVLIYFMEE
ncbi:cyclase family protein [Romboutsia sp.]|uniref:cyclase family protein n=1 Tax=Romboutsia sp. TaxID=1965302 RepID=UPI002CE7FD01|nr:cyclase family protein [Romboutsia sp.]HSQ87413.1 cyclase family protein [Romboutsia sp.]